MSTRCLALVVVVGFLLAGWGEDSADTNTTTPLAETSTTTSLVTGTSTSSPTDAAPPAATIRDMRDSLGLENVTLVTLTEGGSHPRLEWEPVSGATTYWLIVRDGSGQPYWAWTGSATAVRIGGGDVSDLNQTAALHEEMTWTVAAFDDSGSLFAISDPGSVAP